MVSMIGQMKADFFRHIQDIRLRKTLDVEIKERLHSIEVTVFLPNIHQDDVEVYVVDHVLAIVKKEKARRSGNQGFEQTIELPDAVTPVGADLVFRDSTLRILLLKRDSFLDPRRKGTRILPR
ncbi:MAG: Hsp20/alpha crystallin family protein [Planctomycetota bacterium]|nr:Hsp20/alpha crystallin family protein [Planctomycetota bacterium]